MGSLRFFSLSNDARVVLRAGARAFGTTSWGSSSCGCAGGCCDDRRELRRVDGCDGSGKEAGSSCGAVGERARFLVVDLGGLLAVAFFAFTGTGTSSFSGSEGVVLAFFAARVKTKSPSCSSYETIPSSAHKSHVANYAEFRRTG